MKFDQFAVFAKGGRIYGARQNPNKVRWPRRSETGNIALKLLDLKASKNFEELVDGELACMPCTGEIARTKRDYLVTPSGLQASSETPRKRSRFFLSASQKTNGLTRSTVNKTT